MIPERAFDQTCLFFDVDGSLVDIAPRPEAVVVPPSLLDDLERASRVVDGALALVSGRSIAQLDELFFPSRFRASGVHGAEMRFEPDDAIVHPGGDVIPDAVWTDLNAVLTDYPGAFAENKAFSYAVHYRSVPHIGDELTAKLRALVDRHATLNLGLMPGHYVVELKRPTFNKGLAIMAFLGHPRFAGRRPVFIGDDVTDQPGFAAAVEHGGDAFSVGPRLPGTTGTFASPSDVRRWIAQIAATETLRG